MSEIIKCPSCGGFKQVRGCGHMLEKCKPCSGLGYVEKAAKFSGAVIVDDPFPGASKPAAEVKVFSDQYHQQPAEAQTKKRGRPKAVLNV